MGFKQCDKCSETVDEAKAFCPGCGHAFVQEEKRQVASSFDKMDNTVQLGHTMYNQMLSDMGLTASKSPQPVEKHMEPSEKRIEMIAPIPSAVKRQEIISEKAKTKSSAKWFLLGGGLAVALVVFILAAIFVILRFWPR